MSENREPKDSSKRPDSDDEKTVARLMSLAGPRAEIEADRQRRVHDKVRQDWLKATRRKNAWRWAAPVAIAATVVLAVAIGVQAPQPTPVPIGTVSQVTGTIDNGAFSIGDTVYAGDTIRTSAVTAVSIALPGDISLRMNHETAIRLDAADALTLLSGQVYADSGDRIYRDRHITIHTTGGSVTDIGTQFSVTLDANRLDVAVREGRVEIAGDNGTVSATAGNRVTIEPGGDVATVAIAPNDPSWTWASALAPEFVLENKSLMEFLRWAARETGRELIFAHEQLRMDAMGTKVFGSVRDFTPDEAIESVLATTRFRYRIDNRSITILE